jgi:hypothetical protein
METKRPESGSLQATPLLPVRTTREEILNVLECSATPRTEAQIFQLIKGRRQTKVAALKSLLAAGKIERQGGGRKNDPFLYSFPKEKEVEVHLALEPVQENALPAEQLTDLIDVFKALLQIKKRLSSNEAQGG